MTNPRSTQSEKDLRTLRAIGCMYCKAHHASSVKGPHGLCEECTATVAFTHERTKNCPYGHAHNCQDCTTKCNRGQQQQRVKAMMRYAAPRMLLRHPLMTMDYLSKKLRK